MDTGAVPHAVADSVIARWGVDGQKWVAHVLDELAQICEEYSATLTGFMPARYGLVAAVNTPWGRRVFKSTPDPNGNAQGAVARVLGRIRVGPTVRALRTTSTSTWTVMDRINPGTSIAVARVTPATIDRLAELLRSLHGKPPPRPGMPSLSDWLSSRLRDDGLADLAPGRVVAPKADRLSALKILEDLSTDSPSPSLIHGDASSGNIILDANERPYLIDPRGVTGELAYDVAVMATKLAPRLPKMPSITTFAKSIDVDPERTTAWATVATTARV